MTADQIKAAREEFASIHTEAGKVISLAAEQKRELSAEEREQNDKRFARMDVLKSQGEAAERLAKLTFNFVSPVAQKQPQTPASPTGKHAFDAERLNSNVFDLETYKDAVNHFCQTGTMARQLFTVSTSTGGSAYLPKSVLPPVSVRRLNNAFRDLLGFYDLPTISRTMTEAISLPVEDDTANVGQVQSETATAGTLLDSDASGSINLNPTLYGSKQMWLSNTVVNAVDFDLFAYVLPRLQKRVDKAEEVAWTAKVVAAATAFTTAAPAAISYADLLSWEHSLNAAYRRDAGFIVSDDAYRNLRGLVDSNNRPIMDLDPTNQFQARIHGKPVFVSDYLALVGATNTTGILASAEAIQILDAGMQRVARYVLVPGQPDQTGFELFANADLDFVRKGVRTLKQHA